MSAPTITPLRPDVVVVLGVGPEPNQLQIIEQVVAALEKAGHHDTADTFLRLAREQQTDADLLLLAHCTVTVL